MSTKRLTRGRVSWLIRLLGLVSLLLAGGALMLLLAPVPKTAAQPSVTEAAPRLPSEDNLLFPKYSELQSGRATPFEFQELAVAQVALRQQQPEQQPVAERPAPEPTAPKPNIEGLTLFGTAPGSERAHAVVADQQSGLVSTIDVGDKVRDAIVKEIHADRIVLALGDELTELELQEVQGSENLNRQLQGLPPLPTEQGAATAQAGASPAAAVQPPPTGNAVLAGMNSAAATTTVVTQVASAGQVEAQQQAQGTPAPGQDNAAPADGQTEDTAANEQAGGQTTDGAATSGGGAEPPRRSLGISGHMLGLKQQEDLGLQQTGLLVTAVRVEGSPIQVNDVILTIADQTFESVGDAQALIQGAQGDTVSLELFSSGSTKSVSVSLN